MPGPFTPPDFVSNILRHNSRPIPGGTLLPTIRETLPLAGAYKVTGGAHVINTFGAPVIGRVLEYGEIQGPSTPPAPIAHGDIDEGLIGRLNLPTVVSAWMAFDGALQSGFPTGDAFQGFQLGTLDSNTPFPAAPINPCIQVRMQRTLAVNDIVLYTARGDGANAAASLPIGLQDGLNAHANFPIRVMLEWQPGVLARLYAWDSFAHTVKSVTQTNVLKLPNSNWLTGLGLIQTSGTVACGQHFSISDLWIHTLFPQWGIDG